MKSTRVAMALALAAASNCLWNASTAQAQHGNNAPVCNTAPCIPSAPWGHSKTRWRQWPGAVYSEVPRRFQDGSIEGVPPSDSELPAPGREAEVQVPFPGRTMPTSPGMGDVPGGFNPEFAPIPAEGDFNSPPRDVAPPGRSSLMTPPMSLPDREPSPESQLALNGPRHVSNHSAGALPRLKLQTQGADNVAGLEPPMESGPSLTAGAASPSAATNGIRLRRGSPPPQLPKIQVSGEPELLNPGPSLRPVEPEVKVDAPAEKKLELKMSSANPLRNSVVQASAIEDATSEFFADGGPSPSSATITNPLRR